MTPGSCSLAIPAVQRVNSSHLDLVTSRGPTDLVVQEPNISATMQIYVNDCLFSGSRAEGDTFLRFRQRPPAKGAGHRRLFPILTFHPNTKALMDRKTKPELIMSKIDSILILFFPPFYFAVTQHERNALQEC